MNIRNFLTLNAVLVAFVALISLFIPSLFLESIGHDITPGLLGMNRAYGAVIIGSAWISWLLRNEPASGARRAFLLGSAVNYMVFAGVNVYNMQQMPELVSIQSWSIFGLNLIMGSGFAYFWAKDPAAKN